MRRKDYYKGIYGDLKQKKQTLDYTRHYQSWCAALDGPDSSVGGNSNGYNNSVFGKYVSIIERAAVETVPASIRPWVLTYCTSPERPTIQDLINDGMPMCQSQASFYIRKYLSRVYEMVQSSREED